MKRRKIYDKEFKQEAVQLLQNSGKSSKEIADNLGINVMNLLRWRREYEKDEVNAFRGNGNMTPEELQMKKLQKELADVKMERDILKKAMAIFCQPQK